MVKPPQRSAVTGEKWTMTSCWLKQGSLKPLDAGNPLDSFKFALQGPNLTPTTY